MYFDLYMKPTCCHLGTDWLIEIENFLLYSIPNTYLHIHQVKANLHYRNVIECYDGIAFLLFSKLMAYGQQEEETSTAKNKIRRVLQIEFRHGFYSSIIICIVRFSFQSSCTHCLLISCLTLRDLHNASQGTLDSKVEPELSTSIFLH